MHQFVDESIPDNKTPVYIHQDMDKQHTVLHSTIQCQLQLHSRAKAHQNHPKSLEKKKFNNLKLPILF